MGNASRDQNSVTTLLGVSSSDGVTPVPIYVDPTTHRVLVSASGGTFAGLTDVSLTTPAQGDLIYYSGTFWVNLPHGTNGQFLQTQGANANPQWAPVTTSPAGSDTQVQFNDAGSTAGNAALTFTKATGNLSATTFNKLTITAPATSATLTIANGKTFTANNSLTLAGTDSTTMTFPGTSDTVVTLTASQTLTNKTLTSPTLTTPALGVATATSINGLIITTTTGTLTLASGKTATINNSLTLAGTDGKTLTVSNSLTLAGTDATVMTFPSTSATIARTDAAQTFTGTQTISTIAAPTNASVSIASGSFNTIQTYTPSAAGTATLDLSKGNVHHITMPAGNITIALSNATTGQCFIVRILQDGTGSRTVTWFTTIKWAGGVAPTLTTTASKADTLGFEVTGSNTYDGFIVGQNI